MPSKFELDTYNVKKILGHGPHRRRLLFKLWWEGYTTVQLPQKKCLFPAASLLILQRNLRNMTMLPG